MKKTKISIIDNFLEEEKFVSLEQLIQSDFPWYFQPTMVTKEEVSPGGFDHTVYHASVPISRFYSHFIPILEQLNVAILIRIRVNLNPRLPEPYVFQFHTDTVGRRDSSAARRTYDRLSQTFF